MTMKSSPLRALGAAYGLSLLASCTFDSTLRWAEPAPEPKPKPLCEVGATRCTTAIEVCTELAGGELQWTVLIDCAAEGKVCAEGLDKCVACAPGASFCDGHEVRICDADGVDSTVAAICETATGHACRGGACHHLCTGAAEGKSNVGCEYWAVDLDNAMIDASHNAQAQQFAVVVSNPQPDVAATIRIYQDDGEPGGEHVETLVAEALVAPLNLRVFKLGPREVDGSPDGEYNTGTHTALTRHAYRVDSDFPVVAYQFNPLENANVFSNDASLLKPREALTYAGDAVSLAYVVAGWPQTIAVTDDPNTNFNPLDPINLRVFVTVVGTRDGTTGRVHPSTAVLGGGVIPETPSGGTLELVIDAFDVVNLETPSMGSFGADFTGTRIEADGPIAVFSGSEASDAPRFDSLIERRCCADHLEEQLDPVRTAGKSFALARSPARTLAVSEAGGDLAVVAEPEYFRFIAVDNGITTVTTTLPPPDNAISLSAPGDWHELRAERDFLATSDRPIHVAQIMASQDAANVPRGLPGGDPSLLVVPPREQFRQSYVFLTPDKYAFDFVVVVAPAGAEPRLDGQLLGPQLCVVEPTDGLTEEERGGKPPEIFTYRCQLSFPSVDPNTGSVSPGQQNDGVHRITATSPVGALVFGFDAYVSYAYAAGTELREIALPE